MEKKKKLKPIWKILIVAVIICGVIVVDSRIRLTVTEYELGSERLPKEFIPVFLRAISGVGRIFRASILGER